MSREKEVNILVDAKNKSKGAFLEISKDLKGIGNAAREGMSGLASSLDKGTSNIKGFTDKLDFMDKAVKKTFKGAAAISGVYVASTLRDFSKLNSGIANVNTLYDQTAQSQKKMYDDSIKMMKMLPTDFDNITGATYDAISAGADPKYATMFTRKFGMGAVAGNADMPVVTKAAMGTMNAYKLEAKDLNNILDLQFTTVKEGITNYNELASSLGTGVLANAQSAGVTLEELYGSIAMITKNAIPANVATTSLMQLFNQFTNNKTIKDFEGFGVAIQDANHKTRPLVEIFKDLNLQFEKKNFTSEQRKGFLKDMLGSDEASRAIMPLIGDMEEFQRILGNMDKSDGAMKGAFEDQLESVSVQAKLMWNNMKAYGVENVTALKPFMDSLMEPFLKKQKLEFELMDLQDEMKLTNDPNLKKQLRFEIQQVELALKDIDMSPVEAFRDGLKEGVANLEKINPPLAKFVDTVGKFALGFVGEEGEDKRDKYGNIGKGILGVYAFKKGVDALSWIFGKGKGAKGLYDKAKGKGIGGALAKTMQTMNVQAGVVNVFGGKGIGGNSPIGLPGPVRKSLGKRVIGGLGKAGGKYLLPATLIAAPIAAVGGVAYSTAKGIKNPELVEHIKQRGKEYETLRGDLKQHYSNTRSNQPKSQSNQNVKTSKNIEVAKDSSKHIKSISDSMMSFSKTMKELAKVKPEKTASASLRKDNKAESFLMKEINRVTEVDNKINLQNDVKVSSPSVKVSVNIDGKNIPSNNNVSSSSMSHSFMRSMEIMSRRTGRAR